MTALIKLLSRPLFLGTALFFAALLYYGNAAMNFPVQFNLDNQANYAATRYLMEHHRLPVVSGGDPEIYFSELGTTRSLRPPFTFIVSATAAELLKNIVSDPHIGLRLGSPIIAALTLVLVFSGFNLAFKHVGLALAGSLSIGLLPKFVFLASCNNDDIGALLSVSALFTSVIAVNRYPGKFWVLIALAASVGLVLQTKYTAWLTLPWFGLYCLYQLRPMWKKLLKQLPWLLLVCLAAGGWWLVFNMVNYGLDDPSAMHHAAALQASLTDIEPNQQGYLSTGIGLTDLLANHDQFLTKSYKSFIGYLEWLPLEVGLSAYLFYAVIFLIGFIGTLFRPRTALQEVSYLDWLILGLFISQCVFYLHHNLVRDIQPQARYILPIIMPMVYLFLRTIKQIPEVAMVLSLRGRQFGFQTIAVAVTLVGGALVHWITLANYVTPSYTAQAFNTLIKEPSSYPIETGLKVLSASSLGYTFMQDKLLLERTGSDIPTLTLDAGFCVYLPLNALITLNVSAISKGGFYLRLDKNNAGTYEDLHWRSFPAGQSVAVFVVNAENCSGAKITLAGNTHQLTLSNLQISDLRIHRHGKPI